MAAAGAAELLPEVGFQARDLLITKRQRDAFMTAAWTISYTAGISAPSSGAEWPATSASNRRRAGPVTSVMNWSLPKTR